MGSMDTQAYENRIEHLKFVINMMKKDKQKKEQEKEDNFPVEPKKKEDNSNLIEADIKTKDLTQSDEQEIDILNTGFIKPNMPAQNVTPKPSKIETEKEESDKSVDKNKVNTDDIKNNNVTPAANPKETEKQTTQEIVKDLTKKENPEVKQIKGAEDENEQGKKAKEEENDMKKNESDTKKT